MNYRTNATLVNAARTISEVDALAEHDICHHVRYCTVLSAATLVFSPLPNIRSNQDSMHKKSKSRLNENGCDMWVRPSSTIKQERSGETNRNIGDTANTSRFLELADLVLGTKKPKPKKRAAAAGVYQTSTKTEPYTR